MLQTSENQENEEISNNLRDLKKEKKINCYEKIFYNDCACSSIVHVDSVFVLITTASCSFTSVRRRRYSQ